MSLESEVAALTTATTDLLEAVAIPQAALDAAAGLATTQVGLATTQAGIATTQAGIATTQASTAIAQAVIATTQANNAVAVVTGGTAALAPEAGKIPLADGDGLIAADWIPGYSPPVTAPAANKIPLAGANARVDGDWIGVMADKLTSAKDAFNELTAVQQYLIMNMEGLAGYWPADPAYIFEDSGATTLASVDGVVGCWNSLGTTPSWIRKA